jgi:hypothetical protein
MCVIPDYILVLREKQDELVAAFKEHYAAFFPEGALKSKDYGRIVNEMHFKRVTSMLARTKGEIVVGGKSNEEFWFEPTVVKNVTDGDSLLEQYVAPFCEMNKQLTRCRDQGDIRATAAHRRRGFRAGSYRVYLRSVSVDISYYVF